jgi:Transposase, Mutator family
MATLTGAPISPPCRPAISATSASNAFSTLPPPSLRGGEISIVLSGEFRIDRDTWVSRAKRVLAAWGIVEDGNKVLLGLAPGTKEDTTSCRDFLRDLKTRNLADPIVVITDGAPGPIRAAEEVFPRSLRQRCLAHKIRNLQSKVPEEVWRELKGAALAAYQAGSPQVAQMLKDDFVVRYERDYPSATACFLDDFDACIAHLQLPISHRRATRTTNMLERRRIERAGGVAEVVLRKEQLAVPIHAVAECVFQRGGEEPIATRRSSDALDISLGPGGAPEALREL